MGCVVGWLLGLVGWSVGWVGLVVGSCGWVGGVVGVVCAVGWSGKRRETIHKRSFA